MTQEQIKTLVSQEGVGWIDIVQKEVIPFALREPSNQIWLPLMQVNDVMWLMKEPESFR